MVRQRPMRQPDRLGPDFFRRWERARFGLKIFKITRHAPLSSRLDKAVEVDMGGLRAFGGGHRTMLR